MRKKITFLYTLLYSLCLFCQNKGIIVEYNFYESYNLELHLHSSLKNNGNYSLFEINDTDGTEDTNSTSYDKSGNPVYTSQKKRKENRSISKDFTKNTTTSVVNGFNPNNFFIVEEEMPSFNWKIEKETKEILGYTCKKATMNFRGRNYIAWFTTKVHISDGPWKFEGLPGLILEITDDNSKIKIEAAKIILNVENVNISSKQNNKYPKVNWNGYVESIEKDFTKQIKFLRSIASQENAEVELDLKFENMEYITKKDESN